MSKKRKPRVRLNSHNRSMDAANKARDKSYAEAPRSERGRIMPGYKYKAILDGYKELGLEPSIMARTQKPAGPLPLFVVQPTLAKRMVKLIRRGYPYTTVCRFCGVKPQTFKDWLEKGKTGVTPEYTDFYIQIAKAESFAEMRILKKLQTHENADWRVSAWQLERRWPEHWSKLDRNQAEVRINANINVSSKESLGNEVLKNDAARELARRLIDSDSFDQGALTNSSED